MKFVFLFLLVTYISCSYHYWIVKDEKLCFFDLHINEKTGSNCFIIPKGSEETGGWGIRSYRNRKGNWSISFPDCVYIPGTGPDTMIVKLNGCIIKDGVVEPGPYHKEVIVRYLHKI